MFIQYTNNKGTRMKDASFFMSYGLQLAFLVIGVRALWILFSILRTLRTKIY